MSISKAIGFTWIMDRYRRRMSQLVSGPVYFGLIPPDHWYQPDWIDEQRAKEGREKLIEANIIYGGNVNLILWTTDIAIQRVSSMSCQRVFRKSFDFR